MFKKLPETLVITISILLVFIGLTYIIPAGEFGREIINGRNVVVPGTFQYMDSTPQPIWSIFTAPLKGFIGAAEVIAFIFFVGGAFGMLNATHAITAGLQKLVRLSIKQPFYKWLILPVLILFFSFAGASFGMSEETLVFILITIPLAKALGFDTMVGVAIPFVGAGAGFAGAFYNPFTIGIAQGIAEIPLFSGLEYRVFVWVIFTLITILFIMAYAWKITKNPEAKMLDEDQIDTDSLEKVEVLELTNRRIIILLLFMFSLVLLAWGVTNQGWYMVEIGGMFFGLGIISVLIGNLSSKEASDAFIAGAKEMMTACMVVAFCKGILIVATDGKIIDTILYFISESVKDYPKAVSVEVMFLMQSFLNFFLPSGSGQAALTMPIMSPLSDLLGISRQTAVLAFQFGDGLSNMVIPTSGVTMGALSIAKIPYDKWIKWILPLMVLLTLAAMILLLGPTIFFVWE